MPKRAGHEDSIMKMAKDQPGRKELALRFLEQVGEATDHLRKERTKSVLNDDLARHRFEGTRRPLYRALDGSAHKPSVSQHGTLK